MSTTTPVNAVGTTRTVNVVDTSNRQVGATSLDKDTFLKLLVAQLRFQNPLNPSDPTEFMSQTAQFTLVEQMENMAKSTASVTLSQQLSTASTMVGRQITWLKSGAPATGIVDSARIVDGVPVLMVGKDQVPLTTIQSVTNAPAAAAKTVAATTTS
jgi:flagellar basal-body rod modification protein FlgD